MDLSNRLQSVLGQSRVGAEELTSEEWSVIIETAINTLKPIAKYLPYFEPIGDRFHSMVGNSGYHRRVTDMKVVEFPPEFDATTKCLRAADIAHEVIKDTSQVVSRFSDERRFIRQREVYLTQKLQLVLSDYKFEPVTVHGLGYRGHHSGTNDTAVWWKFVYIEGQDLQKVLTPGVGYSILDTLNKLGTECFRRLQGRLANVQGMVTVIHGMRERITRPPSPF